MPALTSSVQGFWCADFSPPGVDFASRPCGRVGSLRTEPRQWSCHVAELGGGLSMEPSRAMSAAVCASPMMA